MSRFLFALAFLVTGIPVGLAQDPDPKEEEEEADEGPPPLTEREKQVLGLFTATEKRFLKDGKIYLRYDFETKNEDLVEDWKPNLEQTKLRVRWTRGIEGTLSTVEHGILVGDYGEWIHEAVFNPEVKVTVDLLSVANFRAGTILAPTFVHLKRKRSLGVAGGYQAILLSGWKPAKPPHPKEERPIPTYKRHTVGYRFDGKVLESYTNGKKTSDTSAAPASLVSGFDTGQVGLAWSGSVQSFIFSVTMEGRLDPDWLAKALGEKPEKGKKPATK